MEFKVYPFKREKKYRFYVKFTDADGYKRRLSTGVVMPLKHTNKQRKKAKKQAEEAAIKKIKEDLGYGKKEKKPEILTLSKYLKAKYYPYLRTNRAPRTLETYKRSMDKFIQICGNRPLEAYKRSHIEEYKNHRFDKDGVKKTTINIEIRSIKAAFNWAYKHEFVQKSIFRGQQCLFNVQNKKREFKEDELQRLFKVTEGTMIGLAIQLAYHTGMRQGELTHLTWKMVNQREKYIHLPASITKANRSRQIPLSKKAFLIVKIFENELKVKRNKHPEWYKGQQFDDCYVLQKERGCGKYKPRSIQDMFRKAMNKAGLPKELTFHCLRHSFATHALEKGADMYGVSKILGHSSLQVTSNFYDHTTGLNYRSVTDLLG